jgi:hypothetical protein
MNTVFAIPRELWGLFVDDGSLALALVLWCAAAGLILPRLISSSAWNAPILFVGCLAILLVNVALAVRRHRLG